MYCTNCGKEIQKDIQFCPYCGAEVGVKKKRKKSREALIILSILAFLLILCVGGYKVLQRQKLPKLDYEKLSESVVKIECYDEDGGEYATGSGVVVLYNNVVVTNYHVVSGDAYSFAVVSDDGQSQKVSSVIAFDENKDLAILQLSEATNITPLSIGDSTDVKRGDKVYAIGSPLGLLNTVSEGIVSGFVEDGDITAIQTSAPISHGSSGGALINEHGELIGITYAGIDAGQNLNFAIPSYEISYVWENGKVDMDVEDFYNLREHIKTYVDDLIDILGEISEGLKTDIIFVCMIICAIDGKVSLRERLWIKKLIKK